jgi:hypothetical protein
MASHAPTKSIDVQKLVSGAIKLEVQWLNAGVDAVRVYLNQAARLSNLASETLHAVQDDKATLAGTARKLTDFGRESAHSYVELSQRLSKSYYDELDRLANSALRFETARTTRSHPPAAKPVAAPAVKPKRSTRRVARKARA